MPKKKKVITGEIVKTDDARGLAVKQEQFKALVEAAMPQWVAKINNTEDMGTAMMHAGQEFLLVIEDALIRYHGFTEADLKRLHREIEPVLKGVKEFERHGLSMLSPGDVSTVGEMNEYGELGEVLGELAGVRHVKLRMDRAGIETPILPGAKPFIKKLKSQNKL